MVSGNPNTIGTFGELPDEREDWIEKDTDWFGGYYCNHCDASFESKEEVIEHLESKHYEAWKEARECTH